MSMDNIDRAIYSLVHDYKGGAPALSERLSTHYGYKIRPGTLMNKANPEQEHQLTVREGLLLQLAQNKYPLLYAENRILDHASVRLGEFSETSDTELLNTYTHLHQELGKYAEAINDALEDGRITEDEVYRIRRKNGAVIRASLEVEKRMESLCKDFVSLKVCRV